ncbi:DUF488 family protein [Sanguibacter sp. A247]|uniref:DUF488 family protein n=1 Tax=unclassified Sanguibacter TaxID=2645534 RepID=UPI003FD837BD
MSSLLTVGHGTLDRAGLTTLLTNAGVQTVVDVRRFPGSRRNLDVSRDALPRWLPEEGIAYEWEERLGGRRRLPAGARAPASQPGAASPGADVTGATSPGADVTGATSPGAHVTGVTPPSTAVTAAMSPSAHVTGGTSPDTWWRVEAFRAYASWTRTATFRDALDDLLDPIRATTPGGGSNGGSRSPAADGPATQGNTVIMCSESVWWRCHRRVIADVAVLARGIPVWHLMHDGRLDAHVPSQGARLIDPADPRDDGTPDVIWDGTSD